MSQRPGPVPRVVGNTALAQFDAIVIGSGAGGSVACWELARRGASVLCLEAGPNHFLGLDDPTRQPIPLFSNDEIKHSVRNFLQQQGLAEPRTFRLRDSQRARVENDVNDLPKIVGGGMVHSDAKYVRFAPFDFRLGKLASLYAGTSFVDWPLTYDELEPYYDEAEVFIGVQGKRGASPFDPPRKNEFPTPPGNPMYNHVVLAAGASKLGYHPFPYPSAVLSVPYRGRPACNDCGFCSGYGCPTNAKSSGAVTWLREALLTGRVQLRSECRVTRLAHANGEITGVDYVGPEGERETVRAAVYVLAASPIEDARLLLLSDPDGAGLGNASGQVGRNLMFHWQTISVGLYPQRIHGHRGRAVSGGLLDFRGDPDDLANHPLGGIIELSAAEPEPISEALEYAQRVPSPQRGAALQRLMQFSPLRDHLAALLMQAEDAPQHTNRVDLDPEVVDVYGLPVPRVTSAPHRFELGASAFYGPKMVEIHRAAGAQYGFWIPVVFGGPPDTRHIMGTLRMGTDPSTSVTDAFGRFHDLGNLYCCDGAVFCTASGNNPLCTIQALALRTARNIGLER
ncbi:MAG: GMC family oxidoreductase [bacterium]